LFSKILCKDSTIERNESYLSIAQCRISYAKLRFYFETNKDLSKKVASKI